MRILAERLQQLRERAGIPSQQALAGVLEVAKNRVWSYEKGNTLPDIDFLARFARATGADLNELIRLRLQAAGFSDEATALEDARAEYMTMTGAGGDQRVDVAAHARRALLAEKNLDPAWSLAIMELATRGEISPEGVDRLLDFVREWSLSDERAWEWIEDHSDEVINHVEELRADDQYG